MRTNSEELTIGIVGLTTIGREWAEWGQELGHEVIGTDSNPKHRATFEAEFGASTFDEPKTMYDEDIDVVAITTPNMFHEPAAVPALERDLHVFIEKPLAHTLESAERIARSARESNGICMIGYHHKFLNHCKVLKSYLDSGYFGSVSHIHATHLSRRDIPSKGSWYTSKELAGGGALIDKGSFVIEFLLYLFDSPEITDSSGQVWVDFGGRDDYAFLDMFGEEDKAAMFDVEDSAVALLEFDNGCTATVEIGWAANIQQERVHSYRIKGTEAGASLDISNAFEGGHTLSFHQAEKDVVDHFIDSRVTVPDNNPKLDLFEEFFEHIRDGTTPGHTTCEDALRVQRIVHDIYENNG